MHTGSYVGHEALNQKFKLHDPQASGSNSGRGGIQNDHLVLMCMLEKSLLLLTYKLTTYLERQ